VTGLTLIVDFSKAFDLVPNGRLLTKIANSGMDSRVVVWIREILLGYTQSVRIGGKLSEVRVMSDVPQGSILGVLLFLAYEKITNKEDMEVLQVLDRLGVWAVENVMKISSSKSKAVCLMRARVKDPLNYSLMDTVIPEESSCKYCI
jgi:hypothetical protein